MGPKQRPDGELRSVGYQTLPRLRLPLRCGRRYEPVSMVDVERKKAILKAEREFERKENLSRALADKGVTLIGGITSPEPADAPPPRPVRDPS